MSSAQKVIKTLAIVFAIFLIINICSGILFGISIFAGIMYSHNDSEETVSVDQKIEEQVINNLNDNTKLKIEFETINLEVVKGTEFKIEKINIKDNLKCTIHGNVIKLKEENGWGWLKKAKTNSTVILHIPENIILSDVKISTGIARVKIDGLKTIKLDIDAGVGNVTLNNIVSEKTEINGGEGKFEINSSVLRNLDFDCGIGTTKISGYIKGKNEINCGIGKVEVELLNGKENYTIETETGIGTITINGEKCSSDSKYGNGENYIRVDGGIGSTVITTNEKI